VSAVVHALLLGFGRIGLRPLFALAIPTHPETSPVVLALLGTVAKVPANPSWPHRHREWRLKSRRQASLTRCDRVRGPLCSAYRMVFPWGSSMVPNRWSPGYPLPQPYRRASANFAGLRLRAVSARSGLSLTPAAPR
jgi:hypothetical protein